MPSLEDELANLSQLLHQEITIYGLLIDALNRQTECLRKGAIDSMVEVIRRIEHYTTEVRQLNGRIQTVTGDLFEMLGDQGKEMSLSHLISLLPPVHRGKLKSYQKTLLHLQEGVKITNEKNKTFIEEHLIFLRHLTSFLIHPVPDPPCYPRAGHASLTVPSYALNREV